MHRVMFTVEKQTVEITCRKTVRRNNDDVEEEMEGRCRSEVAYLPHSLLPPAGRADKSKHRPLQWKNQRLDE